MKSQFYLKKNWSDCPLTVANKVDPNYLVEIDLSKFTYLSAFEIERVIKNIDFNKGPVYLRDINLDNVDLPCNVTNLDLSKCIFENVTNINKNIANISLKNVRFINCTFDDMCFTNISSFDGALFEHCTFDKCSISSTTINELEKISFIGKVPSSIELEIEGQKSIPLPKWYLDNLHVTIAISDSSIFNANEKDLLEIKKNTDGVTTVNCRPTVITRPLLEKILSVINNNDIYNSFDGIDFSDYEIPCHVDLYGASVVGCNLQNASFQEKSIDLTETDFRYANIAGCNFGKNKPEIISTLISSGLISNTKNEFLTKDRQMNGNATFSQEQLKTIRNYTAAAPAVANMCRKAVRKLLRLVLTKAGKTKAMIASYVKVAFDALENFKDEANMLFQLMIGFVCANLHKVGEYVGIDEKSFLKFFTSKKVQAFGEFCLANGQGSIFASLAKRATDFAEMFAGEIFANSDFQRIAAVIENPETASRIADSSVEDEFEAEIEAAPVKNKRSNKHA